MGESSRVCRWAFYKGLWHTECNCYLTTTTQGPIKNYTKADLPWDLVCPDCGVTVVVIERGFGRQVNKGAKSCVREKI